MTTLQSGARLFVVAYRIRRTELGRVWRGGFHALLWLTGGPATVRCDGEQFELPPPSLVCLLPGQVYQSTTHD